MSDREKNQPTGDYDVGYCRTPVHSRFPKGTSGNPGGRPKKAPPGAKEDPSTILRRVLDETVKVNHSGRQTRMTRHEVNIRALVNRANTSDRAFKIVDAALEADSSWAEEHGETGVLVVYPPARSAEEWMQEHGGQRPIQEIPILEKLRRELQSQDDGGGSMG